MTECDGWCKINVQSESSSWPESNGLNYSAVFLLSDSNEKRLAPTTLKRVWQCGGGALQPYQVVHLHCQPLYFENTTHVWYFRPLFKVIGMAEVRGLSRRLWSIIIKGIVHPKMKLCWKSTHPQVIQDVDEFVSSSEQIWRNILCSEWVPSEWESKTADKNIIIIHINPSLTHF